ncbi:cytochrome P450 6a8-like [Zophobas morio]|uniref:cytochrome P450 6a8-like n=1 Tax=Zophobas morio TaxID=2755281 RepID=UPI003083A154
MGFLIQDTLTEVVLIITTVILLITNYFHQSYKYWAKKGVPTIRPHFPLGNTNILLPKGLSVGTLSQKFYTEFKKRGEKFGGVYLVTEPNLVVVDPEYVKDILCKDFQYFVDRGFYYNEKDDPISAHLFALDGVQWRNLRVKLTPTFTSGKMKMMFQTVVDCCNFMKEAIEQNLTQDIEIKEVLGRFTTDVIGSCAFGIECNSFKHPDAEFRKMGKEIFQYSIWGSLKAFVSMNLPKLSLQLGITSVTKEVQNFFTGIVTDTVNMRHDNNIRRNDFLQILMDLKDSSGLTLDEIAAQVFLFFAAGFETSSTTMTFALYELARNPEIQKKLREEICQILERHDGKITYDSLTEMKYLGQVMDETLRKYPPLTTLNRRCTKDYTLRDTDVVIEEGTPVLISTLGLHTDPDFYPEPEKFDPERFSEENKKDRHQFVHLPFGDGPRNCIGLRFGLMQSKIGVITTIKNFKVLDSSWTKPVEFDPYTFMLNTSDKIYLRFEKV